jgi:Cu/Ag efflux protein CusF
MKSTSKMFALVAATALTFGASSALAFQQAAPPAQERPAARASQAQGELVKVDSDAKMITIKNAEGAELQFAFTDKTEVTGAQDGVAGLATKAGTKVTVEYTEAGGAKTATRIAVQAPPAR